MFFNSINSFCSYEGGRVRQTGDTKSSCAVAIKKAQDSDNGEWQCHVSSVETNDRDLAFTACIDVTVTGK